MKTPASYEYIQYAAMLLSKGAPRLVMMDALCAIVACAHRHLRAGKHRVARISPCYETQLYCLQYATHNEKTTEIGFTYGLHGVDVPLPLGLGLSGN